MPWQDGEFVYTSELDNSNSNDEEQKAEPGVSEQEFERPRSSDAFGIGIAASSDELSVERTREFGEDAIFQRIKNSGEIMSIMQAVVDDVLGEGIKRFNYVGRTDNAENPGKRSIQDAKRFWMQNKEVFAENLIDGMAVGDGYLYKKGLDEEQAVNKIHDYVKKEYDFVHEEYEKKASELILSKAQDELEGTEELQIVPATTVLHDINEFGDIKQYTQRVQGDEFNMDPEKVVHFSFMNLNGETYGFTPVQALFAELDMLANAKDYNGVRFDNAAVPNKVFKLPNDGPQGENFEMVKETVKKYRKLRNKHRDIVLTGEIEIEDLNDADDIEFKELIQLIQRILVMTWGVPPSRIGGVMGNEGATESAMAQEGYNRRIKRLQDKYQTLINNEIFEPMFNVRVEFADPDVKSQIRKAERDLRRTEVVKQQLALGLMTRDEAMDYLDKRPDQVQEINESRMRELAQNMNSSQEDMGQDTSVANSNAEEMVNSGMEPDSDPSRVNQ